MANGVALSASAEPNNACEIAKAASTTESSANSKAFGFASAFPDNASIGSLAAKAAGANSLTSSYATAASAFASRASDLATQVSVAKSLAQAAIGQSLFSVF